MTDNPEAAVCTEMMQSLVGCQRPNHERHYMLNAPRFTRVALMMAGLLAWAVPGRAQSLRPFSAVKSACPACDPGRDRVLLKGGETVQAWVVADNGTFFVLERFGELRALGHDQVESVTLSTARTEEQRAELREKHRDQVLLDDGEVYSGVVVEENAERGWYRLKSGSDEMEHLLFRARVVRVFKGGAEIPRTEVPKKS